MFRVEGTYLGQDPADFSGTIAFSGEVTLSGTYIHYSPEEEFLGDQVCFDQLDEASLARLPRARGDERYLWFCFTNREEARQALAPAGVGETTVVIDGYTVDLQHTETWNTARLVRVETVRNPRPWTKPVKVYPEGMEETRTFRLIYLPIPPLPPTCRRTGRPSRCRTKRKGRWGSA